MTRPSLRAFIRAIPAIELHLHLEGSLRPETSRALARRHGMPDPRPRAFEGFGDFLKAFGATCDLLADEEDFRRAASDLLLHARRTGVIHAEVMFSPQVFMRRGIALATIMRGLLRARAEASRAPGFSAVYILDGVRQWGGEWLDAVVREASPYAGRGLAAVGIGGDERALPVRDFARAFRRARGLGLRAIVHAGEARGADSVREAITVLGADRIGHGIRAAEDPALTAWIARRGVTLDVCPSSNLATRVVPSLFRHPLRTLFDTGVRVTVNSDDATMFATHVRREMEIAARAFGFSREEIVALTLNAAHAAFLPPRARARLARRIGRSAAAATRADH